MRATERRVYVPAPRSLLVWTALLVLGVLLDGGWGAVPAFVVAIVAAARLERSVLGAIGVFFVALAGLGVLLESTGTAADVHQDFVLRNLVPHHLMFIGLALVMTKVALESGSETPADDHDQSEDVTIPDEPLPAASPKVRIGIVAVSAVLAASAVVALVLT